MFKDISDKDRILNSALALYSKFGIKSITMDDLCRELGMSKKTLYQHVEDKNDLITQVLEHEKVIHQQIWDKMTRSDLNAIDELIHVNRQVHLNQGIHSPTFYFDLKKYYPQIYSEWMSNKRERMYEMIHRNLQKGLDEGLYREDLNPATISKLHMSRTETLHSSEILEEEEIAHPDFIDEVFKYHIHGICNDKGLAYFKQKQQEKQDHKNE